MGIFCKRKPEMMSTNKFKSNNKKGKSVIKMDHRSLEMPSHREGI